MNNLETIILDNGLKIYLYSDLRKHSTFFQFTTLCGGLTKHFKYRGCEYHLSDGISHILEHYIVECNDSGNFLDKLGKRQMSTNASTQFKDTSYYFETVEDVLFGIKTMLEGINNVSFKPEKLEKLKNPILQEIRGKYDNKFYHLNKKKITNLFNSLNFTDIGGTLEEVKNAKIEDLKILYDALYQPSNQFIVIAGNFNKDEVLGVIRNFYAKNKKKYYPFELIRSKEDVHVNKKNDTIYFPTPTDYCDLSFKFDVSNYTSKQLLDLDFFLHCFFGSSFGITSPLYKRFVSRKIITETISCTMVIINKTLIISIGAYTYDLKAFSKGILDEVKTLNNLSEEKFELDKKSSIVGLIMRDESIFNTIYPFIYNIVCFNYPYMDKVLDIDNLKYTDYVDSIKRLDFSNYTKIVIKDKK